MQFNKKLRIGVYCSILQYITLPEEMVGIRRSGGWVKEYILFRGGGGTDILPSYICTTKNVLGITGRIYSTFCTGTDHATLRGLCSHDPINASGPLKENAV